MDNEWRFEPESEMGGATGEAWENPLAGAGLPSEYILARESIQNSADAHRPDTGAPARIVFRRKSLTSEAKKKFVQSLGLNSNIQERAKQLGLAPNNSLANAGKSDSDLSLLLIEDYNTVGLGGDLKKNSPDAHFRKLLLRLGDGGKSRIDNAELGGSFGYGKSVYSSASDVNTVIYYSVFDPTNATEGTHARIMGCAYFQDHELDGVPYTGRAWYGDQVSSSPLVVHPFVDETAHSLARELGIEVRDTSETGLSILIVGATPDMDRLREGIETFWWPKLHDRELQIELWDDEKKLEPPRPLKRDDLRSFISCYDIAKGVASPAKGKQDLRKLRPIDGLKTGNLASEAIAISEDFDPEENGDMFFNSLALIRRAKMVVEYAKVALPYGEPVTSVYIADGEMDHTLMLSEPPAHDKWDSNSRRLTDKEASIVKALHDRLRNGVRAFQRELSGPVVAADARIKALEKHLGRFLQVTKPGPPRPPPNNTDPIEVNLTEERKQNKDGEAVVSGEVRIKLRQDASVDSDIAKVIAKLQVLANDNESVDGEIPLTISSTDPTFKTIAEEEAAAKVELTRDEFVRIMVESDPFDQDWTTKIAILAEKADD